LINVPLVGRQPGGTVSPQDLDAVRTALVEDLKALRSTPSSEPLFKDVRILADNEQSYKAGEFVVYVFAPADVAAAINLHVPLSDSLRIGARCFPLGRWNRWQPGASGQHSEGPPGIVILHGKPFKRGVRVRGARIHDIAPTVIAALGLPVAQDLEGALLTDAFSPRFLLEHPPAAVPSYGPRERPERTARGEGEGDAALLKQLRSLGYIR